jgi:hypothetical protein
MDLRLQNLILNFSSDNLLEFFKAKVSSFKPLRENLNYILSDNNFQAFSELNKIGEIDFNGVEDLLVFACKTDRTLTERSSKKQQFEIAKKALKVDSKDGAIFVYYDSTGNFRFSFVRKNYGNKEQKFTNWKRFTYYVEKDKTNKTFKDRVGNCDFSSLDAIQKAFSVEKLTEDFYKELFAWYTWTLSEEVGITFPNNTEIVEDDRVKLEEQIIRLITRLLFVWFIKQKQLVPAGLFETEKLSSVLKDFEPNSSTEGNYYNAILQNLFFATLNKSIKERGFTETVNERDIKTLFRYDELFKDDFSKKEIIALFNEVPFLNGGLFECLDKEKSLDGVKYALDGFSRNDKKANGHFKHRAFIPNCVFFDDKKGIIPLLERYNFTVEENAPNEIQVALDPELLGNVFENLLGAFNPETKETARKQSGSFYTPREIVSYMVDESLIFYLLNAFPNLNEESIRHLFTEEELPKAFTQNHNLCEEVSQKLKEIKILDPACGSGAFPMGILNRMVTVLEKLACHKEKNVYDLKLHLIEECIYGVDIQTIAVQISKLRFFISLIVEQEEMDLADENYGVNPLPNLETKFVAANTLIGLASANKSLLDLNDKTLEEKKTKLWDVRKQHFYAKSAKDKKRLRVIDENLRDEIKDYISANASKPNTVFIQQLQNELTQLEKKRKNAEGELWVDETTKHTQVAMFDSVEKNPSIFKVDKNLEERKKIDTQLKAIQAEIIKENNKTLNVGFEKEIETIAKWNPYDQNASSPFFDVEWMFGLRNENPDAGCFDVVIGNPPYGAKLSEKEIKIYKDSYFLKTSETAILFIEKGFNLLNNHGIKTYIVPKSLTYASNYEQTRDYVLSDLVFLVDCGKAFDNVKLEATIFSVCRNINSKTYDSVRYSNDKTFVKLSVIDKTLKEKFGFLPNGLTESEINMGIRIQDSCVSLGSISKNSRGEFLQRSIGPFGKLSVIGGKEINKYGIKGVKGFLNDDSLITNKAKIHINSILAQNIVAHLTKPYNHLKIIACIPDVENHFIVDTINQITITDNSFTKEYLWCLLNSKLINWYSYSFILGKAIRTIHFDNSFTSRIPIKENDNQQAFSKLVDKILLNKTLSHKTIKLENEVDNMIYKLYNLTHEEVFIIDPEFSLSQSEYDNLKIGEA